MSNALVNKQYYSTYASPNHWDWLQDVFDVYVF